MTNSNTRKTIRTALSTTTSDITASATTTAQPTMRSRKRLASLGAGALAAACLVFSGTSAATAAPEEQADTWVTWTSASRASDCSSQQYADLAASRLCGRGVAYRYPQQLASESPQTPEEFRAFLLQRQAELAPGERMTVQTDRYTGTPDEIAAVVEDGRLTGGEDSHLVRDWRVVVLEGKEPITEEWVTWVAPYSTRDCTARDMTAWSDAPTCGNGLTHAYPQKLADEQPESFAELPAYLERIKAGLAPGESVSVQMDRYVGTKSEIEAVLEDGLNTVGEDRRIVREWRVAVVTGAAAGS